MTSVDGYARKTISHAKVTQTPMKKPNSLRGLKTEAKLAKKDMAVVKVVAAVDEAACK